MVYADVKHHVYFTCLTERKMSAVVFSPDLLLCASSSALTVGLLATWPLGPFGVSSVTFASPD